MATRMIDFHAHVYPNRLGAGLLKSVSPLRKAARGTLAPVSGALHAAQTWLRQLPGPALKGADFLGSMTALPALLLEAFPPDLARALDASGVERAVIIAHPPVATNEFILETCAADPRFIAAVNIPKASSDPQAALRGYAAKGARLLKIHPPADGEGPASHRYQKLLETATELGLPVILHTGCIHSPLLYKDPAQGHVGRFAPWFERFPRTRFILAHMNFHYPEPAILLAKQHENVFVDTSWQPSEVIARAVRTVGAERVLFGTDWPLLGHNIAVGLARVRECVRSGAITADEGELVLGGSAARLLALE